MKTSLMRMNSDQHDGRRMSPSRSTDDFTRLQKQIWPLSLFLKFYGINIYRTKFSIYGCFIIIILFSQLVYTLANTVIYGKLQGSYMFCFRFLQYVVPSIILNVSYHHLRRNRGNVVTILKSFQNEDRYPFIRLKLLFICFLLCFFGGLHVYAFKRVKSLITPQAFFKFFILNINITEWEISDFWQNIIIDFLFNADIWLLLIPRTVISLCYVTLCYLLGNSFEKFNEELKENMQHSSTDVEVFYQRYLNICKITQSVDGIYCRMVFLWFALLVIELTSDFFNLVTSFGLEQQRPIYLQVIIITILHLLKLFSISIPAGSIRTVSQSLIFEVCRKSHLEGAAGNLRKQRIYHNLAVCMHHNFACLTGWKAFNITGSLILTTLSLISSIVIILTQFQQTLHKLINSV
ncbi:uncharacterized protein [Centruroides vittatus]|uniref:uncharacterized protein n=1 Tax=Centruroides vittatus TaxID=120091 RepID=UPI00351033A9